MTKKDKTEAAIDDLSIVAAEILDNPGYEIGTILSYEEYEEKADEFKEALITELTQAGQIAEVDKFFMSIIRDDYRVYITIRDQMHGLYDRVDRFGDRRQHHLLSEYRAYGKALKDNLRDCGATPRSRDFKGGQSAKVPHGNSKDSSTLDIINGQV